MRFRRTLVATVALTLLVGVLAAASTTSAAIAATGRARHGKMIYRGTTKLHAKKMGGAKFALPEIPDILKRGDAHVRQGAAHRPSAAALSGLARIRGARVHSATSLDVSFQGLNHFDQRFANGGNQFSLEPPDQGLCVGNGYVVETVNDVMRVFDASGNPLSGVVDLNTFYGYPAQYNRTTGDQGPFLTDPTCYYDPEHQRFVHVLETLEVDPASGAFTGPSHLDIAVSQTGDPTGAWNLYSIPTEDNGTQGQPNHHCSYGNCFGDYPKVGADKFGFYISTNEYSLIGPEYHTAQIYAISKSKLASGSSSIPFVHIDNILASGKPGFTVWPASSPAGQYQTRAGGTEYFLSTTVAAEARSTTGVDNKIVQWTLSNTRSLDARSPVLILQVKPVRSEIYGTSPLGYQKPGPIPLAKCLNVDCAGLGAPPYPSVLGRMETGNSGAMQEVWYADGKIWGAADSVVAFPAPSNSLDYRSGVAWFIVRPNGTMARQGYLGVQGEDIMFPALATTAAGQGVIAFTLAGPDYYPSAAYAPISMSGVGDIQVAAWGVGPQDGFTEYWTGVNDPSIEPIRPRWGDYGWATSDGDSIWMGSEYIAQRCSSAKYLRDTTCGGTRSFYANWATRISSVTP